MSTLMRPVPTISATPSATEADLLPEVGRAALYDAVVPWALDLSSFVPLISAELSPRTRPVMIELGCGTGGLALQVMRAVPSLTYYGFDDTAAMLQRFSVSARAVQPGPAVHLAAPVDLTRKINAGTLQQTPKADVVLLNRFVQTIPMMVPSPDTFTRADVICLARQMLRPGGKLVIIEDIYGATGEEHRSNTTAWDDAIITAAESHLDALREWSPEMLGLAQRHDRVGLIKAVRSVLDRGTPREPLPWASWQFLLDQLRVRYATFRHPALPSVWFIRGEI